MSKKVSGVAEAQLPRRFTEADIPAFLDKIFAEFDQDRNQRFTKK